MTDLGLNLTLSDVDNLPAMIVSVSSVSAYPCLQAEEEVSADSQRTSLGPGGGCIHGEPVRATSSHRINNSSRLPFLFA